MKDYGHWDVSEVGEFNVRDYIGFVYVVEFDDGFMYGRVKEDLGFVKRN